MVIHQCAFEKNRFLLAIGRQGPYLLVHNITRYCSGTYTCHAFNGVGPAVSRVFSINVHCMYTIFTKKDIIFKY